MQPNDRRHAKAETVTGTLIEGYLKHRTLENTFPQKPGRKPAAGDKLGNGVQLQTQDRVMRLSIPFQSRVE